MSFLASYPARGTWIEMSRPIFSASVSRVVPRTGYVDRNISLHKLLEPRIGRTPHGVRG